MRNMFGYLNRTHCEIDGSWPIYEKLAFLEALLVLLSLFYFAFFLFVIATAQTHRNVRVLNLVFYGQYFLQLIAWINQPILFLTDKAQEYKFIVAIAGFIRVSGLIYAFFCLPALVLERSCATFLVENYEKSSNALLGNIILMLQIAVASIFSASFIKAENTVIHIMIAVSVNSLAFVINKYNEYANYRLYHSVDKLSYSLSERFQITENIRTAKMFNKTVYIIGIFNMIINACMIIDNYDIPTSYRNLTTVVCDYSVLIYGFAAPFVTAIYNVGWNKRIGAIFRPNKKNRTVPLKDTFGHDMGTSSGYQQTSKYFDMLADQWK